MATKRAATHARGVACSSSRSVAGGGVRDNAVISPRNAMFMSIFTESSEARSCSMLRAPMIGAVTAGCAPVHATAALTGCIRQLQRDAVHFMCPGEDAADRRDLLRRRQLTS